MVEEELLRKEIVVLGPALPHDDGSGHQVSQVDLGTGHLALQAWLHGPDFPIALKHPDVTGKKDKARQRYELRYA